MIRAWRLTRRTHAVPSSAAFSGRGAELNGGRWNAVGTPAAYGSASAALAALEYLVHVDPEELPADLVFAEVSFDEVDVESCTPPPGWRESGSETAVTFGEAWLHEQRSLVLAVPSAVIAFEMNYVFNPAHDRAGTLTVAENLIDFIFDDRLLPLSGRQEHPRQGP
ncbi:MAG: RES domain-containing protein [Candidatus Eremiobacteraeota bacterium]|nr:RES domain-containing protein [Candidatus Eremiobacteraeota bacterium]